jgi:hypothetical protein
MERKLTNEDLFKLTKNLTKRHFEAIHSKEMA